MRCLLLLTLAIAATVFAQAVEEPLALHSTVSQTLASDEERVYRIQVPAGHTVEVSIRETQGMAGILSVLAADGYEVAEVDFAKRIPTAKSVLIGAGNFRLKLTPANHSPMARIFQLSIGELRPITESNASRFTAERLTGAAEAILRKFQPNYLDDALAKYEAALELWKRTGDRPRQADTFNRIGFVLHFQGKMKPALEAYQQALDLMKDDGAVTALFGLAFTYYDTAQYAKSAEFANQALELARKLEDPRGQSDALSVVGLSFMAKGDNDHARTSFLSMLDAARRAGDRVREGDAHNDLGLLEYQLGNYTEGEGHYSQALAFYREEHEPVRVAQELNNLGVLYANLGDQRKALRNFEEALPIRKALAQPGSYANTLYNAAVSHASVGNYQQALDGYNEALPIFRRVGHRSGEAYTLQELGEVSIFLGESSRAEEVLRQALAIRRDISDRRGEVQTLEILGSIHTQEHRYPQALQEYREALSISHAAGYQREEAQNLGDIGRVMLWTGEPNSSLEYSGKSLELSRKIGDKTTTAFALRLQGVARGRLGDTKAARDALDQALALHREIGSRSTEAGTLLELARLDIKEGLLEQAASHVGDGLNLVESLRASFGSRKSRMEVAASLRLHYELAIDVAMQLHDTAKAFEISERARARGLVDLVVEARLNLREGVEPELLAREREGQELLDAKHERLMRLLGSNHSAAREAAERREIDELLERYQTVETEIRAKSPQYAALTQPRPLSLSEVQALLPDTGRR